MSQFDWTAFSEFCTANDLDENDKASGQLYSQSLSPTEGGKREYTAKTVTLHAIGKTAEGERLFRQASGVKTRSRHFAAERLRNLMMTDGAVSVLVGEFTEIVNK